MEVTFALGEQMLLLAGAAASAAGARQKLGEVIASGAALGKFREIVAAQGGDTRVIDDPSLLPRARIQSPLKSPSGGYVGSVDALDVAMAALGLGAGRTRAEDRVDPAVGVSHLVKTGEKVAPGGTLCVIHANDEGKLAEAKAILGKAIKVGTEPGVPARLVDEIIG
jgi:thymidine phosphorylase